MTNTPLKKMCTPRAYTTHTSYLKTIAQQRDQNRRTKGTGSEEKEDRAVGLEERKEEAEEGKRINYGYVICKQDSDIVPGSDRRTVAQITCFRFQKLGHSADFCHEIVGREQLHMNAYKIMGNEENISSKEEGHEVLEEIEVDKDTSKGKTEGGKNEIFNAVKRGVESVCSQNESDREETSSNIDNSMVASFHYLHGRDDRYDVTDVLLDTRSTRWSSRTVRCSSTSQTSKKTQGIYERRTSGLQPGGELPEIF